MKKINFFEKFQLFLIVEMIFAVSFSLFCLNFHFDISILAFPLSAVFTALFCWFGLKKVLIEKNEKYLFYVLKFVQYIPTVYLISFILQRAGKYGLPSWVDVVGAILWTVLFVGHFVLQHYMSEKRVDKMDSVWVTTYPKRKKPRGLGRFVYEIVDWIDSILQVVFFVFIVQVFTFQLYIIPSESMVPQFLIKDRVFVEKIGSGPKFPLTNAGLPVFSDYKRGDVVVLRNPHYTINRESEVKSVTSQLIYMLTFMTVNLNRDENGEMKADPLVKRVCGVEGEQLVMQDGVLYTRTKNSDEFKPIPEKEDFACWNLNSVPKKVRDGIQTFPLSEKDYEMLLSFEEERRNFDLNAAAVKCQLLSDRLEKLSNAGQVSFSEPDAMLSNIFGNHMNITLNMLTQKGGTEWFREFMTSWVPSKNNIRDIYEESNFRLNVMTKLTFGQIAVRCAELFSAGVSTTQWNKDAELMAYYETGNKLYWYIEDILDMRNMPVFPANDKDGNAVYLPKGCYFMMGDNRFNSLDLRHSYDLKVKPLCVDDEKSVSYNSMMAPTYLHERFIVGKPVYCFWPVGRQGSINRAKK